jgi:hypothetical protein
MKRVFHRRQVLRGMLAGGVVSVGLPILDVMLNDNGDAFADTGKPLPIRFASWFWPCGYGEGEWTPKNEGADYALPWQLQAMTPFQKRMNFFTGSQVFLDGNPENTHFTPVQAKMTGKVTPDREFFGSIDQQIADAIGSQTRFRSLVVAASGDPRATWSARPDSGILAAETSPFALYQSIFGPEFKDPNAASFTPDAGVILRRSVLSDIADDRNRIMKVLGAADRAKLDSYFTSLRSLEQQLDVQLQKPQPLPACTTATPVPKDDGHMVTLTDEAMVNHDLFTKLFVHALACDQTRVVNLNISVGLTGLRRAGDPSSHHVYTHEEPVDPKLGYQPICGWFEKRYMQGLHDYCAAFDNYKEGDRSLLDRMLIFAYTDHGSPRYHSLTNDPMITIGSAAGRMKTGMHIRRVGEPATRVSYTVMQAMGVSLSAWGTHSNAVNSPVPGVLA